MPKVTWEKNWEESRGIKASMVDPLGADERDVRTRGRSNQFTAQGSRNIRRANINNHCPHTHTTYPKQKTDWQDQPRPPISMWHHRSPKKYGEQARPNSSNRPHLQRAAGKESQTSAAQKTEHQIHNHGAPPGPSDQGEKESHKRSRVGSGMETLKKQCCSQKRGLVDGACAQDSESAFGPSRFMGVGGGRFSGDRAIQSLAGRGTQKGKSGRGWGVGLCLFGEVFCLGWRGEGGLVYEGELERRR